MEIEETYDFLIKFSFPELGISGSRAGFVNKFFYLTLTFESLVLTVILNICPPNCDKYESNLSQT